jgi:hypothetical protein
MSDHATDPDQKRDWRISATLGIVWVIALIVITNSGIEIPASMLVIATVFFVLLIPAMNDLVRSIERASENWISTSPKNRNSGGKHE